MKSILGVSLSILLMPSAYAAELPGDSADGKRLHDTNCMGCHDTAIYTRNVPVRSLRRRASTVCLYRARYRVSGSPSAQEPFFVRDHRKYRAQNCP